MKIRNFLRFLSRSRNDVAADTAKLNCARTERYFIEDQTLARQLLTMLQATGERAGYYEELYIEPDTGQKWEKYEFELASQDAIGLRKYPYPDLARIIDIAVTSPHFDEVEGAAAFLRDQELRKQIEFRHLLLDRLEADPDNIDPGRFDILYHRAELYDRSNNRGIIGKHYTEIDRDAEFFASMARRACEINNKFKAAGKLQKPRDERSERKLRPDGT